MHTPIVFIHRGDSEYLKYSFYQIKKSNPKNPIILIGDNSLKKYSVIIKFFDISDFCEGNKLLDCVYKHYSPNDYDYELFCLQRWFVLKDFLSKQGLKKCLYLDSDVLFYGNVDNLEQKFNGYGMTINLISPHINFVALSVLTEFCAFIIDIYSSENSDEILKNYSKEFLNLFNSGISDMTFFWNFYKRYPNIVFDFYSWNSLDETFDLNIHFDAKWNFKYVNDGVYLKVNWREDLPYFILKENGKPILTHGIHFQGSSKKEIMNYIPKKDIAFYTFKKYLSIVNILKKYKLLGFL